MSTTLSQQRAVEIADKLGIVADPKCVTVVRPKDLHAAMEQYHREASYQERMAKWLGHGSEQKQEQASLEPYTADELSPPEGWSDLRIADMLDKVLLSMLPPASADEQRQYRITIRTMRRAEKRLRAIAEQKQASVEPVAFAYYPTGYKCSSPIIKTERTYGLGPEHGYTEVPLYATQQDSEVLRKRVSELEAEVERLQHKAMMANNRAHLLEEDIYCLHHCLDGVGVPREDAGGSIYSMWGRVLQFRNKDAGLYDLLHGSYLDFLTENNLHLKYLPIYADQPDPTYIKDWVWEIRYANGSAVAQAHKWLYSAIDAALAARKEG